MGLGGMIKECANCKGIGFIKENVIEDNDEVKKVGRPKKNKDE